LRTIARACNANWDLVESRMGPEPEPPPLDVGGLLDDAEHLAAAAAHCRDDADKHLGALDVIRAWADALRSAHDEYEQLRLVHRDLPKVRRVGR
jgi:hypothetical protein